MWGANHEEKIRQKATEALYAYIIMMAVQIVIMAHSLLCVGFQDQLHHFPQFFLVSVLLWVRAEDNV